MGFEMGTSTPVRPRQQRAAAAAVVLAADVLLFSSCKRRKAFAFHKLSEHINSRQLQRCVTTDWKVLGVTNHEHCQKQV